MHGTNSEKLIALQEPIVVDGYVAVCDGGGGALGHPIEFIQLNRVNEKTPEICTYCGLRFVMGNAHHWEYTEYKFCHNNIHLIIKKYDVSR